MAVTADAFTSGNTTTTSATTVTVSHTIAAQANAVLFALGALGTGSDAADNLSCTYNGVAGTAITAEIHSGASTVGFLQLFWWPIGTGDGAAHNIVLTVNNGLPAGDALAVHGASFYGASQTEPVEVTATGQLTVPSLAISSTTGGQVLWGFGYGQPLTAATQTLRTTQNVNGNSACGNSTVQTAAGTGGSITAAHNDVDDWWAALAVPIAEAVSASVPPIIPKMATRRLAGRRRY